MRSLGLGAGLCVALLVISMAVAHADVPQTLNVQGRLTDSTGAPLPAGDKTLSFSIYDAESNGNKIWPALSTEDQVVTTGGDGLWTVYLGAVQALTNSVFSDSVRWLEISVTVRPNEPVTLPRTRLVTGAYAFRVSTVDGASGGTITSKVSIGRGHTNTGVDAFVAGAENEATGDYSSIGGGRYNKARGDYSVIGGGGSSDPFDSNLAATYGSTVAGGSANRSTGSFSTISGGAVNGASGDYSTVSGGSFNGAAGEGAAIGGGKQNTATGAQATVSGGLSNIASGLGTSINGGYYNKARGDYSVVSGGGGPTPNDSNSAIGDWSTVGGGSSHKAIGDYSAVGGGDMNVTPGMYSTIAGGSLNYASAFGATISGGIANDATGLSASIPGGDNNEAAGSYSFAAGRRARADNLGCFVWADSSADEDFTSTANNQFLIRAAGGVGIGTTGPLNLLHVSVGASGAGTDPYSVAAFESNSNGYISVITPAASERGVLFGDELNSDDAGIIYNGANNRMDFRTNNNITRMSITSAGLVGIGTATPAALLHVNGTAGNNTGVWSSLSDRRLKRDIEPMQGALETVNRLQGVNFHWKDDQKDAQFGRVRGLVAQDVEVVIPEWVRTDPDGLKRVEPIGIDALLIEAIKELKAENEELRNRISALEKNGQHASIDE